MAKGVSKIPKRIYPGAPLRPTYERYFDGRLWRLTCSDSATGGGIMSLAASIRSACKRRGISVNVCMRHDKLYVQAQLGKAAE